MLLSILPKEERTDLTEAGFPGLVAVWRPMDLTEKAAWFDHSRGEIETADAKVYAVKQALRAVEGLEVEADGVRVPFDVATPEHFNALPMRLVTAVWFAIIDRTAVSEALGKN